MRGRCDARSTVTFLATERHRPLVTEAHGCEQLAWSCYLIVTRPRVESNTRLLDRKSVALTVTPPPSHPTTTTSTATTTFPEPSVDVLQSIDSNVLFTEFAVAWLQVKLCHPLHQPTL